MHLLSQQRATSHLSHITETFLVTPFSAHTHLLRVADGIGQCFLPRSSNLTTWMAAVGGLPIGLCTFRSCPACANKFLSRVFRKSLSEIFLPQVRKKGHSYSEWPGQTDGRRVSLSTSMCDGWWNRNLPFYLPYLHSPRGCYNPPQFAALWPSRYYCRNYPLLVGHGCSSKYVCRICPSTVWLSSHA